MVRLAKEELLLLLLATSPTTSQGEAAVYGSTRLQKLVFLSTRESTLLAELCPDPYPFVAYDYGPYSGRLDRDVERMVGSGLITSLDSLGAPPRLEEMSFEFLTHHLKRSDSKGKMCFALSPKGVREAQKVLKRLKKDGVDTQKLLEEYQDLHKLARIDLEDLLRYVYQKYPEMAAKTKRPDLRPTASYDHHYEDGDDTDD